MFIQLQNFGYKSSIKSTHHEGIYNCSERIHQFHEIIYVFDGSIDLTVDGITETANAGDIAVITSFRAHSIHTDKYCKIWIGVISSDLVSDFVSKEDLHISGTHAVFTPSDSLERYVVDHIPNEHKNQFPLDGDIEQYRSIKSLVYTIFEEYVRTVPQIFTSLKDQTALVSVLLYISEHFKEIDNLQTLATKLGYTSTHLSHCISVIPNMNFRKLLNSMRIDYAKNMLISKNYRMIDVALECGYSSERTFYRAFYNIVGMTPAEYKKGQMFKE